MTMTSSFGGRFARSMVRLEAMLSSNFNSQSSRLFLLQLMSKRLAIVLMARLFGVTPMAAGLLMRPLQPKHSVTQVRVQAPLVRAVVPTMSPVLLRAIILTTQERQVSLRLQFDRLAHVRT